MVTTLDKNTALVLIDLQNGIVSMPMATPFGQILENVVKLVEAFRKAALPIVIVNVNPAGNTRPQTRKDQNPTGGMPFKEDWLEIIPEIKTQAGDIFITKHTWGAFFETALHEELQQKKVTGIVLAGVATNIGVEATARQATELGYNITFAKDAMTDRFAEAHGHSLEYIFPRIGEVDGTDAIIDKL